jgi:uncharacterized protein YndB with AHSA1/START domain
MKSNLLFNFVIDRENKAINVKREFAAPIEKVWATWTKSELLDQWWGPKPWKAATKKMNFEESGSWLYAMVGPEGEKHWSIFDYQRIETERLFEGLEAFCDENGNINEDFPRTIWHVNFASQGDHTIVEIKNQHQSLDDMEKLIEMGFQEGFTTGLNQLEELLAKG